MEQQLSEAFTIMLTGMVTVFLFLTLLLFAMGLLRRVAATDEPLPVSSPSRRPPTSEAATDKQRLAAISAAVHTYRREHE